MKANRSNPGILFTLAAVVAVSGCVKPVAPPPPPPRPFVTPGLPLPLPPKPPADWRDAPASPGNWSWRKESNRSVAFFGDPKMPSYGGVSLICDLASRRIELLATSPSIDNPLMTVVTTSGQWTLNARRSGYEVSAQVATTDPMLDAMAFSRGRFMISVQGQTIQPYYVPSWPELSRVIEDCR